MCRPVAVDLYCGSGGWTDPFLARGWRVVGYDIEVHPDYRGELIVCDVLDLTAADLPAVTRLILASPPCEQFSRHDMPWTRALNPAPPDLRLVAKARALAAELGVPLILENVRGAQRFIGPALLRWGAFYLWGDGVPPLLPTVEYRLKESRPGTARDQRARIPAPLADWIAHVHTEAAAHV